MQMKQNYLTLFKRMFIDDFATATNINMSYIGTSVQKDGANVNILECCINQSQIFFDWIEFKLQR